MGNVQWRRGETIGSQHRIHTFATCSYQIATAYHALHSVDCYSQVTGVFGGRTQTVRRRPFALSRGPRRQVAVDHEVNGTDGVGSSF
jgi:hypothetical protein